MVRALHRYRRGQGSNPGKPDFFRLSFRNCISCVDNCEDRLYIYFFHFYHHFTAWLRRARLPFDLFLPHRSYCLISHYFTTFTLSSWGSFFRSGSPFSIFSLFISFCVGLFVSYFALLLVLRFIFYFYLFIYFVVVLCSCSLYCEPAASAWDLGTRKFVFRKASGLWPGKPAA